MTVVEPADVTGGSYSAASCPAASAIADARCQSRITLAGAIRATETVCAGSSLAYRCVLADGSGELDVLFLGRPVVAGLTVGTCCSVTGMVTVRRGRLAMWNPSYRAGPAPPIVSRSRGRRSGPASRTAAVSGVR